MVSSHVRLDRTEVIGLRMKDIQAGGSGGGGVIAQGPVEY